MIILSAKWQTYRATFVRGLEVNLFWQTLLEYLFQIDWSVFQRAEAGVNPTALCVQKSQQTPWDVYLSSTITEKIFYSQLSYQEIFLKPAAFQQ